MKGEGDRIDVLDIVHLVADPQLPIKTTAGMQRIRSMVTQFRHELEVYLKVGMESRVHFEKNSSPNPWMPNLFPTSNIFKWNCKLMCRHLNRNRPTASFRNRVRSQIDRQVLHEECSRWSTPLPPNVDVRSELPGSESDLEPVIAPRHG